MNKVTDDNAQGFTFDVDLQNLSRKEGESGITSTENSMDASIK